MALGCVNKYEKKKQTSYDEKAACDNKVLEQILLTLRWVDV